MQISKCGRAAHLPALAKGLKTPKIFVATPTYAPGISAKNYWPIQARADGRTLRGRNNHFPNPLKTLKKVLPRVATKLATNACAPQVDAEGED